MNKKFSTLVGCLLAGTVLSTVSAHDRLEYRSLYTQSGMTNPSSSINRIEADKWYQLRSVINYGPEIEPANGCLIQVRDQYTGKVYLKVVPELSAPLLSSLWRIKYTRNDGQGGGKFTFVNKETNLELSFDHSFSATPAKPIGTADNAVLEACNTEWEWYNNNQQTYDFAETAPYSYIDADATHSKVMILKRDVNGLIYSYTDKASNVLNNHNVRNDIGAVSFQPVVAAEKMLTAQEFNSMIDFNKASEKQYGEFRFYKPNGDLLNAELVSDLVTGGVMGEGQKYEASADDVSDIYHMALHQAGFKEDVKDKVQALRTAKVATGEARSKEDELSTKNLEAFAEYRAALLDQDAAKSLNTTTYAALVAVQEKAIADADEAIDGYGKYDQGLILRARKEKNDVTADQIAAAKAAVNSAITAYNTAKTSQEDDAAINVVENAMSVCAKVAALYDNYEGVGLGLTWNVFIRDHAAKNTNSYVEPYTLAVKTSADLTVAIKVVAERKSASEAAKAQLMQATEVRVAAVDKEEAARNIVIQAVGNAYGRVGYIMDNTYLRLKYMEKADGTDNTYLMVDTAFWQNNQIPSKSDLKIAHKTPNVEDAAAIAARYFFKMTYFPTQDSLVLEPLNASVISDREYANDIRWKNSYAGNQFVYAEDVIERAQAPSNTHTAKSNLPIVIKLDELNTSDLCLTAAMANPAKDTYLKTRIAFNNPYQYLVRTTLPEGLYSIKERDNGKYVVANMEGQFQYDVPEDAGQDYLDMPATMFVVKKAGCQNGTRVSIFNREYGNVIAPAFTGQLYKEEDGTIYFIDQLNYADKTLSSFMYPRGPRVDKLAYNDHYTFTQITEGDAVTSKNHGYNYLDPATLKFTEYAINYNWALNDNLYLNVGAGNFINYSEGANSRYELSTDYPANMGEVAPVNQYGYGVGIAGLKQLERQAYVLKVRDANLIDNDTTYVALVKEVGKNEYYKAMGINDIRAGKGMLAQFYLKADQINTDSTKYYTMVDVRYNSQFPDYSNGARQINCKDLNGKISHVDLSNEPNERASAFALVLNERPLYKSGLGNSKLDIYRLQTGKKEYLFNDSTNLSAAAQVVPGFNYLGISASEEKASLSVDSVVSSNAYMPQYMLAQSKDSIADGYWCVNGTHGYFATKEAAEATDKGHYVFYNGYTAGKFLVSLTDSITDGTNAYQNADKYKWQSYTRLGFVEGVHMNISKEEAVALFDNEAKAGEYFFTLLSGKKLADLKDAKGYIIPAELFNTANTKANKIENGKHNNYSFSIRLINDTEDAILIESKGEGSAIGSFEGAWVKVHNGIPVLAQVNATSGSHAGSEASINEVVNQAQKFFIEAKEEGGATSNESITTSSISVIAKEGAVQIVGATGKKVVISNILGQIIANTIVSSDNATIAVPAGIVVVAVEGEAAVKAIVK